MEKISLTYLVATLPALLIWVSFYLGRKDLRREMLSMSMLIGILGVATSYYWWTVDWWHPLTLTGTKVGLEDFIMGFSSGGIVAVAYEVITDRRYSKRHIKSHGVYDFFTILFFLAQTTMWLFYGVGLTSFYASAISMILAAGFIFFVRRDLVVNGVMSGIFMTLISVIFYATAIAFCPAWISQTYFFDKLSGVLLAGVPIEEFIFWFLSGLVFGPFYEFWKGFRLKKA